MKRMKCLQGGMVLFVVSILVFSQGRAWAQRARAMYAGKPCVAGELLVRVSSETPAGRASALSAHSKVGARILSTYSVVGWQRVQLPKGMNIAEGIAQYRKKGIADVEPNYIYHALKTPNDPRYPELWGMWKIQASAAWEATTGSQDIVVAVIDTGVDYTHEDLSANMWTNPGEIADNDVDDDNNGYVDDVHGIDAANGDGDPMDDQGHGTHCAGTIGGVGNNGTGVVGVNWSVRIMALKFLDDEGSGSTASAIECLEYAVALKSRGVNIRVTNNSWGGPGYNQSLKDAFDAAGRAGIINCCAAGNGGPDGLGDDNDITSDSAWTPNYPSSYDSASIVAVAASNVNDDRAEFSNYGRVSVDLAAPGVSILSSISGTANYEELNGTSMASPHVAGALALFFAKNPTYSVAAAKARLLDTVDKLPQWKEVVASGGRLNLARLLGVVVVSRPDLLIKKGSELDSAYAINNVYQSNPAGDQTESLSVPAGSAATYAVKIENDGNGPASFYLKAEESRESGWTVVYRIGTTNITSRIRSGGGYQTPTLEAGDNRVITLEVTPNSGVFGLHEKIVTLRAYSGASDTVGRDAVKATTTVIPEIRVTGSISPDPGPVGGILTAMITVTRSAYTSGFRVDFYRNLRQEPVLGQTGDNYFIVPAGTDSITRAIQFRPSATGTFTAWAQADTLQQVVEVHETDNTFHRAYRVQGLSISGRVSDASGQPISGVTIIANSSKSTSVVTGGNGRYNITGLGPGLYTVTPSHHQLAFDPPMRAVNLTTTSPSATGVDFTGAGVDISVSLQIAPQTSRLGKVLTAVVTVSRSAATKDGFWVDLYYNRGTRPGARQAGDYYFFVQPGSEVVTKYIKFTPSRVGTFSAWVQVDTDLAVSENTESNNIAGPITYTVQPAITSTSLSAAGGAVATESSRDTSSVVWETPPPEVMVEGMNYAVSWRIQGGETVNATYVVMSTSSDPMTKPLIVTQEQAGRPGTYSDLVPAPSSGGLYYQLVAIVDGRLFTSPVLHRSTP